jgi:hypothetical protein
LFTHLAPIRHLAPIVSLDTPLKDSLKYIQYVLRSARISYRTENKQGLVKTARRRRFSDYETHLKVWDLRHGANPKALSQIARMVFPHHAQEHLAAKARDHLKAARRLIMGGYKEIT